MRVAFLLLPLAAAAVAWAPRALACEGSAAPAPRVLPSGSGTHASGARYGYGYREAPSIPISQLPTLPPTRGYSNPATGYYAPGPAVGVQPLPRPQPRVRVYRPYVYRPHAQRPYRRIVYR